MKNKAKFKGQKKKNIAGTGKIWGEFKINIGQCDRECSSFVISANNLLICRKYKRVDRNDEYFSAIKFTETLLLSALPYLYIDALE